MMGCRFDIPIKPIICIDEHVQCLSLNSTFFLNAHVSYFYLYCIEYLKKSYFGYDFTNINT